MADRIKPLILPARAHFHPEKVQELATRLNDTGTEWEWAAQEVVPQKWRIRNLERDIAVLQAADPRRVIVDLDLEHFDMTFGEYVQKLREAMEETQEEMNQTPLCLYGLGLGRFSEGQIATVLEKVGLIWMSPTYYQRWPGDAIRDHARDLSLARELRCPVAPFYCGNYASTRGGGALLPLPLLAEQMDAAKMDGITVGFVWSNLDWPGAIDGILNAVAAMGSGS